MGNKAVFVDRDGTLVEEVNFLSRVEHLNLFPFTAEAIGLLKESGYLVIVVSNQSGVGRGLFEESAVRTIHEEMQRRLSGQLDGLYFCPHLPDEGCECRKPGLGMIMAAASDFDIDLSESWMVGDKKIDVETGFNAGMATALVKTGYGNDHAMDLDQQPELIADNLLDASKKIVLRSTFKKVSG
jgi:D-glycero-D-manno-heptose 1,7-bisphosphate phosphatase